MTLSELGARELHTDECLHADLMEHWTDGRLLEWYVVRDSHLAFATLVQRYGRLVLGVCERVLHDRHDAEDAFQATFLVLARRAVELDRRGSLGNWLHSVAYRTALKARRRDERHRALEREAAFMSAAPSADEGAWAELRPVLDEELNRLPTKYRAPLVLCFLEGKTHLQAARELGWPSGSISKRLERAREMLRHRLLRRGVALPTILLSALLSNRATAGCVPKALEESTIHVALVFGGKKAPLIGVASGDVAILAEQVLKSSSMFTLRLLTRYAFIVALILGSGAGITLVVQNASGWSGLFFRGSNVGCHSGIVQPKLSGDLWTTISAERVHDRPIQALVITKDGKLLASVSQGSNQPIRIMDVASGREVLKTKSHTSAILALAIAPDGKAIASAGEGGIIRLWSAETGAEQASFQGHLGGVSCIGFSPDGRTLASGGLDGGVRLWRTGLWSQPTVLCASGSPIAALAYSPDGSSLASAGRGGLIRCWKTSGNQAIGSFRAQEQGVTALIYLDDSKSLVTAGTDGTIAIWDVAARKRQFLLTGHTEAVTGLAPRVTANVLISASLDRTLRLWRADESASAAVVGRTNADIRALAWSPSLVAAGSDDGTITVFQHESPELTK